MFSKNIGGDALNYCCIKTEQREETWYMTSCNSVMFIIMQIMHIKQ